MAETFFNHGMGWRPDLPDFRDYDDTTTSLPSRLKAMKGEKSIKSMTDKIGLAPNKVARQAIPDSRDLRGDCPPVEDQESIGSCTAHAGIGIVEYYEKKAYNKHIDASRLFLYKTTRNLLHWTGDTGAYLRSTMAAMALFGAPPEEFWEYNIADYDVEPSAFCYAFGQNYQALQYYRLDKPGITGENLLKKIKQHLAYGIPLMFGFTVFNSIGQARNTAEIPYPCPGDRIAGGHAVMAVGYNDKRVIKNSNCNTAKTKGALLIRNSWGSGWGDGGYGWLPYDYVLKGLAKDWWSLLKSEWVDLGIFGL
ncbi:MAG: C1 family peptidase [Bacteroidota bacterium]